MNKVEEFYSKIQNLLGGTVPWNQLSPMDQMNLVQAINVILNICQTRK